MESNTAKEKCSTLMEAISKETGRTTKSQALVGFSIPRTSSPTQATGSMVAFMARDWYSMNKSNLWTNSTLLTFHIWESFGYLTGATLTWTSEKDLGWSRYLTGTQSQATGQATVWTVRLNIGDRMGPYSKEFGRWIGLKKYSKHKSNREFYFYCYWLVSEPFHLDTFSIFLFVQRFVQYFT